jgi:malate dehydrogenase
MAIPGDGSYGISQDIIYSYPVTIQDGTVSIVQGLDNNAFIQEKMKASEAELLEEREAVASML